MDRESFEKISLSDLKNFRDKELERIAAFGDGVVKYNRSNEFLADTTKVIISIATQFGVAMLSKIIPNPNKLNEGISIPIPEIAELDSAIGGV